jgi:Protein of unknown function (DUF1120)
LNTDDKGNYRMLNKIQKTVCALVLLATTSLPAMAESIDVRIIGNIRPVACEPRLVDASDHGTIAAKTLNPASIKSLPSKILSFFIACGEPAKIAFTVIDIRLGTGLNNRTGLGMDGSGANAVKIGVRAMYKVNWTKLGPNTRLYYLNTHFSVAKPGELVPLAFTKISSRLRVLAQINKG